MSSSSPSSSSLSTPISLSPITISIGSVGLLTIGSLIPYIYNCVRHCSSSSSSSSSLLSSSSSSAPSPSPTGPTIEDNVYESSHSLNEYLLMHYGTMKEMFSAESIEGVERAVLPVESIGFPMRCAEITIQAYKQYGHSLPSPSSPSPLTPRVLDVGCAVGASSFYLTQYFPSVLGIDYSHSFVQAANQLRAGQSIPSTYKTEGDISSAWCPSLSYSCPSVTSPSRAHFQWGDACSLSAAEMGGLFDCVMGANLLCRLPSPLKFLDSLSSLMNKGGIVVLFSPYTWLSEYTHKDHWLGGREGGRRSSEVIEERMAHNGFQLLSASNVPFLIKETARKYQWTLSHCMIFKYKIFE